MDSCADDICLPDAMPVILVTELAWNLAFVCNRGGEVFELVYEIAIGSTSNLRDLYKLLAVLRILGYWVDIDLRQWFERLFHSLPSISSRRARIPAASSATISSNVSQQRRRRNLSNRRSGRPENRLYLLERWRAAAGLSVRAG